MGSLVRVSIDSATGMIRQVVIPTNDAELSDPAHSPKGCVSINMDRAQYNALSPTTALPPIPTLLNAVQPAVAAVNAIVGAKVSANVSALTVTIVDVSLDPVLDPVTGL